MADHQCIQMRDKMMAIHRSAQGEWLLSRSQSHGPDSTRACIELCFFSDSLITVNWINGIWNPKFLEYQKLVSEGYAALDQLVRNHLILPPSDHDDFIRHIPREYNTEADILSKTGFDHMEYLSSEHFQCWRVYFDGSFDPTTHAMRTGILVQGAKGYKNGQTDTWCDVVRSSESHTDPGRSIIHS